jgi:glycosyltransferase involved in cell wall biosynthesis
MPVYQGWADRALASLTHRAVAVSASTRDFLVRQRHVPAERVRLIWNGAPLDEFAPVGPERARAARRSLGLPVDAPVLGTIGRLSEQKGHRVLLEALPALARARDELRVVIVGDGDLLDPLRQKAAALGLAERVVFAGHRADVPDLLGAIDVLCLPSLYEGTPLALFEAMAAGKAIVATAVDGNAEVLEDGRTGLLVPARDPAALAQAVLRVLEAPTLRARLGAAARQASRDYDIETTVRRLEALYDEVLAGAGTGRAA